MRPERTGRGCHGGRHLRRRVGTTAARREGTRREGKGSERSKPCGFGLLLPRFSKAFAQRCGAPPGLGHDGSQQLDGLITEDVKLVTECVQAASRSSASPTVGYSESTFRPSHLSCVLLPSRQKLQPRPVTWARLPPSEGRWGRRAGVRSARQRVFISPPVVSSRMQRDSASSLGAAGEPVDGVGAMRASPGCLATRRR